MSNMDITLLIAMLKDAQKATARNEDVAMAVTTNTMCDSTVKPEEPARPQPTNRCAHSDCKKKLLLSDPTCRCHLRFCLAHRMSEVHACTYDYKAEGQKQLTKNLPKTEAQKFERI